MVTGVRHESSGSGNEGPAPRSKHFSCFGTASPFQIVFTCVLAAHSSPVAHLEYCFGVSREAAKFRVAAPVALG